MYSMITQKVSNMNMNSRFARFVIAAVIVIFLLSLLVIAVWDNEPENVPPDFDCTSHVYVQSLGKSTAIYCVYDDGDTQNDEQCMTVSFEKTIRQPDQNEEPYWLRDYGFSIECYQNETWLVSVYFEDNTRVQFLVH